MKHLIIHVNDTSVGFSLTDEKLNPLHKELTVLVQDNFSFAPLNIQDYLTISVCNNQSKKENLDYQGFQSGDVEINIVGKRYRLLEIEDEEVISNY